MSHALTLASRLAQDSARFDLLQALRVIESAYPDRPRLGRSLRPGDDVVRLAQEPRFGFVAAELGKYRPAAAGEPGRLIVNVAGLFGPNSPMPLYFTEYAHNRMLHAGDPTLVRFLDIFNHRLLSVFYRAWANTQPVIGLDRGQAGAGGYVGYVGYVSSLCGLVCPSSAGAGAAADLEKLQFSSLLASRTRPASGLGLLLSQYFGVPVAIQQFVGQWLRLARPDRTALQGHGQRRLGEGLVLGSRVWDRQNKFRVVIGPVGARDMRRLLPGTSTHRRLLEWVDLYTGGLLEWDVELRVKPEEAPCLRLDGSARLSRTGWLGRRRSTRKSSALCVYLRSHVRTPC
jgi:type VI secretion system protein ImpH